MLQINFCVVILDLTVIHNVLKVSKYFVVNKLILIRFGGKMFGDSKPLKPYVPIDIDVHLHSFHIGFSLQQQTYMDIRREKYVYLSSLEWKNGCTVQEISVNLVRM